MNRQAYVDLVCGALRGDSHPALRELGIALEAALKEDLPSRSINVAETAAKLAVADGVDATTGGN